jgi:putative acetyltransferase
MEVFIRKENKADYFDIKMINDLAFGLDGESKLVEQLRKNPDYIPDLSLVADFHKNLIGHILFFPIHIINNAVKHPSLALAPMSVLPEYQNKGIGSLLVKQGLMEAKKLRFRSVIVLGHPEYYPRFGFQPASKWNIRSPYEVPDEVFMALELIENGLNQIEGMVIYPNEFDEVI